jgi:hypothetical protein
MRKTPRTLAVAGVALVAGLGVGATIVPASAAQDPVLTPEQQRTLQTQVDAYTACLTEHGVTLPDPRADGPRPELTDEQRAAMRTAREACEAQRPQRPELTDEQRATLQSQMQEYRTCMDEQLRAAGIIRPEKPADGSPAPGQPGSRPARPELTDEQKAALESARTACEDVRPNLGVAGVGPMGGPGGHGPRGFGGGPGGRSGPGQATSAAV